MQTKRDIQIEILRQLCNGSKGLLFELPVGIESGEVYILPHFQLPLRVIRVAQDTDFVQYYAILTVPLPGNTDWYLAEVIEIQKSDLPPLDF